MSKSRTDGRGGRDRRVTRLEPSSSPPAAIIQPLFDVACTGGLSLVVITGFLIYGQLLSPSAIQRFNLSEIAVVSAAINWPHFMAAYRILYSSRTSILAHRWASTYVPAILIALLLVAMATAGGTHPGGTIHVNGSVSYGLWLVSAFYLAWHYTGQAWGMIVSFAHLGGVKLDGAERRLIRAGCRYLLIWHVVWGLQDFVAKAGSFGPVLRTVYVLWSAMLPAALVAGVIGFLRVGRRSGRPLPWRMVVPWASLFSWYALLYFHPGAFFWVQIAHALQYLPFPLRVELNRHAITPSRPTLEVAHAILYYSGLVGAGLVVFRAPYLLPLADAQWNLAGVIASIVNIHHYFVDGVIWKLGNPAVRRDLFAHLATDRS